MTGHISITGLFFHSSAGCRLQIDAAYQEEMSYKQQLLEARRGQVLGEMNCHEVSDSRPGHFAKLSRAMMRLPQS